MNKDIAYLLGVLIGDGNLNKRNWAIILVAKDKEFIDKFYNCLRGFKIGNPNIIIQKPAKHIIDGNEFYSSQLLRCYLYSKRVFQYVERILDNHKTYHCRVPLTIFKSNKKCICSFIEGFWDSEGSTETKCFTLSSASKQGLLDVQKLLTKLNIRSILGWRRVKTKIHYRLRVYGKEHILRFHKLIKCSIPRKQEKMNQLVEKVKQARDYPLYTEEIYNEVLKLKKQGLGNRKITKWIRKKYGFHIARNTVLDWMYQRRIPNNLQKRVIL